MAGSFMDKAATRRIGVFICFRPQIYSDATEWISVLIGQVIPSAPNTPTAFGNTIF
jgi:hypothetical protein